ncbi:MAG: hypothetical protein JW837_03655 [Sedimentisphaerales bacterium]|nr:hypothetical protein [Sedimentisphaerales bacterium]
MRRLVITWVLAIGLFGLNGIADAEQTEPPFVNVYTTPDKIDLGTVPLFGDAFEVPEALTVNVESNCLHGPIMISTTKLKRPQGGSISPDNIFVRTPATGGYVAMAKPVAISKPTTGSHKVVLDLRVQAQFLYPAGEYSGTLTLTIMPPA